MKLYNSQLQFYCGIDLHEKTLHICVLVVCYILFLG
jgi:hypothetical protein